MIFRLRSLRPIPDLEPGLSAPRERAKARSPMFDSIIRNSNNIRIIAGRDPSAAAIATDRDVDRHQQHLHC